MSNKIDILYVVGTQSLRDNAELKYSLRCISEHARNVGRVIISGNIPDFVGGNAVTVPCDDIRVNGKHWNMLHKIEQGIRTAGIEGDFLVSSDDHFITRNFDMEKWPRYTRGEIYDEQKWFEINGKPCGKYQRSICATRRLLEHNNLPIQWTCWHGNTWLNASDLDDVINLANSDIAGSSYGYEPTLLFTAIRMKKNPNLEIQRLYSDVKAHTFEEAMSFSDSRGVFSVYDRAFDGGKLMRWFKKKYPNKSEFEK